MTRIFFIMHHQRSLPQRHDLSNGKLIVYEQHPLYHQDLSRIKFFHHGKQKILPNNDLNLGDMTSIQGHDIPLGH